VCGGVLLLLLLLLVAYLKFAFVSVFFLFDKFQSRTLCKLVIVHIRIGIHSTYKEVIR